MTSAPNTFTRAGTTLADQVLDCFPSGAYALSGLLRLMDNPGFVAANAATPERLLMLVMHELHHVLLGHTTLFPTPTPAHNFVFDAVINGVISRMFPAPEYTSLLTGYYDADSFPQCLLRPPPGWPGRPQVAGGILTLTEKQHSDARDIHAALYSEAGASYQEVFELLPRLLRSDAIGEVPLLGGHAEGGAAKGNLEQCSPVLFDIVRSVVEKWPQPPHPIRGRSLASILETSTIRPKRPASARATLRSLMRKVASCGPSGRVRQPAVDTQLAPVPIPTLGRRTSVLRALGYEPLLHAGPVPWRRQVPAGQRVHVYLDVSGSMDGVKNALYGAILDSQAYVHPTVHLFSTEVADISLGELRAGVCKSTGGTDIACVAAHMEANRVRRGLIVTDGWVGKPHGHHLQILSSAKLAVAFLGSATNTHDLAEVADFTAPLTIGA